MKARRISTGEEVEVSELTYTQMGTDIVHRRDIKNGGFIPESDLDFNISAPEKKVIEGWVCRGQHGCVNVDIHIEKPQRDTIEWKARDGGIIEEGIWSSSGKDYGIHDKYDDFFPDITWQSEPKRVRIEITLIDEKGE